MKLKRVTARVANQKGMPAFYKIDKERRLVLSTGSGVFSLADALSHQQRLSRDPDFDSSFSQIADFTYITRIDLSGDDIRQLAQTSIFAAHSRRAFIVPDEVTFGLGRMYAILRGFEGEKGIPVFRTLDEVLDWAPPKSATA
jgi:hypothetical protein